MVESRSNERRSRVRRDYWWASPLALTCLVAIGAAAAAMIGRKAGPELGPAILVLSLLTFPYIAFATTSLLRDLQIWIRRVGPVSIPDLCIRNWRFFCCRTAARHRVFDSSDGIDMVSWLSQAGGLARLDCVSKHLAAF